MVEISPCMTQAHVTSLSGVRSGFDYQIQDSIVLFPQLTIVIQPRREFGIN